MHVFCNCAEFDPKYADVSQISFNIIALAIFYKGDDKASLHAHICAAFFELLFLHESRARGANFDLRCCVNVRAHMPHSRALLLF